MTCKHDPLYRINNEAAGGAGCPICKAQGKRRVMVAVDTAAKANQGVDQAFIDKCNDTPTGSQWADRGEDHE